LRLPRAQTASRACAQAMTRSGARAFSIGLAATAAVAGAALIATGCSGQASAGRQDPPVQSDSASATAPRNTSLPGADVSKARDGGGDLRRVHFHSRALGRTDSYLIYLPPGYS